MNKKIKIQLLGIFAALGFATKESRENLTNEDWNKVNAEYQKKFGRTLAEDLEAPEEPEAEPQEPEAEPAATPEENAVPEAMQSQIINALNEAAAATGGAQAATPQNFGDAVNSLINATNAATALVREMGARTEPANPIETIKGASMTPQTQAMFLGHSPNTNTHVFGIQADYFKRGSWWNELSATGEARRDVYRDEDATEFRAEFNRYAKDFAARCNELASNKQINLLDYNKMVQGESWLDYTNMNTKLGEYVVRRMDAIIAYLRTLKSVADIFPVVSNVQNKMTAPTAFFEELSQSYKSGHHFKGAVNFDGEIYHVDDVMFKFFFDDPKQLEKEYIGYYNREGSNPMKWTLFEWCIVHFGTLLFNEQQTRRIVGVKVARQGDFPQPANFASDGVLRAIERVEEENKVLPFDDLKMYDRSTMVDYFEDFYERVMGILPNIAGYKVYANEKHYPWYVNNFREKYGKDTDFSTARNQSIMDLSPDSIIWVPNMAMVDYKVWIAMPNNVENYEDRPNEMYAFYFQQDLEQLIMASWWKEGAGVLAPGVQFATKDDLEKSRRKLQWLFTNNAVCTLDPDATTIDGNLCYAFETGVNTGATAITTIDNASSIRVYKIVCGDITNVSTIAKSGDFSEISAAWTPTAVGDYIKVYAELKEVTVTVGGKTRKKVEPTGKFLELERKVS